VYFFGVHCSRRFLVLGHFHTDTSETRGLDLSKETILFDSIYAVVHFENFGILLFCLACAYAMFKATLRDISNERKEIISGHMRASFRLGFVSLFLVIAMYALAEYSSVLFRLQGVFGFFGVAALLVCYVWIVSVIRATTVVWAFFLSKRRPVPLVLINVITFCVSILVALVIAKIVFGFSIAPLLATSAVLSLVLGLALQDTLGNLFTGIALQIDKPFRIGDWIELQGNGLKSVGQVVEINWRATVLQSFTDEMMIIPNRLVAQSQISNYSSKKSPVLRGLTFRFPHGFPYEIVRDGLVESTSRISGIYAGTPPVFLVIENGDSWVVCRLLYAIQDFGNHFVVSDRVYSTCYKKLAELGVTLAAPEIRVNLEKS
jgi:small-conductance mechanosensitive channel